jgi:hypothetical protein
MTEQAEPTGRPTPVSGFDSDFTGPLTAKQGDSPPPARPDNDAPPHGPGGMDAIDEEPIRAPNDDDAPGGMTGIPENDDS